MSAPSADVREFAIRLAATSIGALAAGPLGAALGSSLAGLFADQSEKLADKLADQGAEGIAKFAADYWNEKLPKNQTHPPLEKALCEALRSALKDIYDNDVRMHVPLGDFADWFENWIWILKEGPPVWESFPSLVLPAARPQQERALDGLFRSTMERLDGAARAQRAQNAGGIPSIVSADRSFRTMPDALLDFLLSRLPLELQTKFNLLVQLPKHQSAWIAVQQNFQSDVLSGIAKLESKIDRIIEIQERELTRAIQAKDIAEEEVRALRNRIDNQEDYKEKYLKLLKDASARTDEPEAQRFAEILDAGDLEAAAQFKTEQIERKRNQMKGLALDYAERGRVQYLRFARAAAADDFREAWRLNPKNAEYGLLYANASAALNHLSEATETILKIRSTLKEPTDIAAAANLLGLAYTSSRRVEEAEESFKKALTIYRSLAETEPSRYLPKVASTLIDLATLYQETNRLKDAAQLIQEVVEICVRLGPDLHLNQLAETLNTMAGLFEEMGLMKEAEECYQNALKVRRLSKKTNSEVASGDVAFILRGLASVYAASKRTEEAEKSYQEALAIYRTLANAHPEAYQRTLAGTLFELALHHLKTQRADAMDYLLEALNILKPLWEASPDPHDDLLASVDMSLAILFRDNGGSTFAQSACQLARQALQAASDLKLKADAQRFIDEYCAPLSL